MNDPKKKSKPTPVERVYAEVLALSSEEREKLAVLMDKDLNSGWASSEIKQAWMEEIERREQLHRDGKNPDLSLDKARDQVLAHLDSLQQ